MNTWFERGAWVSKRARPVIEAMDPLSVRRIAVIRHAALGDMVLVRPFLAELRRFFPNARLVLSLVSNYTYGAPEDLVDELHVIPGSDQRGLSLRAQLSEYRRLGAVDLLFDLADTTRSRYLTRLTKATLKIGFPYRGYLRPLLFDAAVWRSDFVFEAVNMLHALMLFGADPRIPPDFAWPERAGPTATRQTDLIYFPFASVGYKCWPRARFVSLIQRAAIVYPSRRHIVLGGVGRGESERRFADELAQFDNIHLQSCLSFDQLLAFIDRASLVVSNDTGIRNLAIALETPTVGIFFATVPYRYWPRYSGHHQAVFRADGQIPEVAEVLAGIESALERQAPDCTDP